MRLPLDKRSTLCCSFFMAAPALKDAIVATELVLTTIGMVSSLTVAGSVLAAYVPGFSGFRAPG